jgi:Domain of unknown function (DUF4347)
MPNPVSSFMPPLSVPLSAPLARPVLPGTAEHFVHQHVLFIDARVPDLHSVIDAAAPATLIVVLRSDHDGFAQMASALHGVTGLQSISVVSHGSASELTLGSSTLSAGNLLDFARDLWAIGEALSHSGDVVLYGCNVGAGPSGEAFVSDLAKLVGADFAASDNLAYADSGWDSDADPAFGTECQEFSPILNTLVLRNCAPGRVVGAAASTDTNIHVAPAAPQGNFEADFFSQIGVRPSQYLP